MNVRDPWFDALVVLARRAKSQAAAPDYDEEAIRDALWALADAVLNEAASSHYSHPDPEEAV